MNEIDKKALLKGYRRWEDVIQFIAPECSWEIGAIAFVESTWEPEAVRYESAFMERYILADTPNAKAARRRIAKTGYQMDKFATSWGLMQIMGIVAMERGYHGDPAGLLVPELSLLYGALHFKHLWDKHGRILDAIASYNAGSPRRYDENEYVNQGYVDDVLAAREVLRTAQPERGC